VLRKLRSSFTQTALGPVFVIWAFGYLLVDIFASLIGRSALGLNFMMSLPMLCLGVGQTLALHRLRDILRPQAPLVRLAGTGLAVAAATAVQSLFDVYWLRWVALELLPQWQPWALEVGRQRVLTVSILYLWTFCLALTLLWANRLSNAAARSAARASAFEAESHRAQSAALRLQLNPHFLFNALNSIASLVTLRRNPEAEQMIDQLSDFLRASLASDPMADVRLSDEIDTIDAYLGIEAARFGDRLEIDLAASEEVLDARLPNFILQPLVENAIKHGVSRVRGPAKIEVKARGEAGELILCVDNRSEEPASTHEDAERPPGQRHGIGLDNIRQRLSHRYGERARLETGPTPEGFRAVIRLPLIG
jgi:two-component system, LytTR family, sensor kinase